MGGVKGAESSWRNMPLAAVHIRKKSKGSGTIGLLADATQGHGVEDPEL